MDKHEEHEDIRTPGTLVLVAIFFFVFVMLYVANWVLLSEAMPVR